PKPNLIATFKTKGEALGLSKGLDRDRAVDESGNQIAVFGRRGARPFNLEEMMRMQRTNDGTGDFFKVSDRVKKSKVDPSKPVAGFLDYLKSFWMFGFFGIGFLLVCYKIASKSKNKNGDEL